MMIEKKYFNKILSAVGVLAFSTVLFMTGCATQKLPEAPEPLPDYTEKDVHESEVKRITEMLQTSSVQALWRAKILGDKELTDYCANYVRDVLYNKVDQKEYFEANTLYHSLVNCGYSALAQNVISKEELEKKYLEEVPGIKGKLSSKQAESVSTYINGTVTIWVDLGIKVERGVGYANRSIGSGFFIDKRGYIVTNHHVIAELVDKKNPGYGKVYIKLAEDSDTKIPAKIIGWDKVHDLALLKTEIDPPYIFSLGSSEGLSVGDRVYAIGSPLGLERTLTSGVVSATDRKLFTTGSVMQIDAAVNSGNSGGPCIDVYGNVQAIVFAGMLQFSGLNFAIPIEYLKQELPVLYYGGERHVPWIGAYGHSVKSAGKSYGLEVQYYVPGSAMARAGIPVGSVINSLDGYPVRSLEDVQNVLRNYVPGVVVTCSYIDPEGNKADCLLYLTERPEKPGYEVYTSDMIQNSFVPLFGMQLVPSSTSNDRTFMITKVLRGSVADDNGFSENDPITVGRIQFDNTKSYMMVEMSTKKRRKGYLDVNMAVSTMLDSPYYF